MDRTNIFPAGYDRESIEKAPFHKKLEFILMGAFSDDFDRIYCQLTPNQELNFAGIVNDKVVYSHTFNVDECAEFYRKNMLTHYLDSVGFGMACERQTIILENRKAAN